MENLKYQLTRPIGPLPAFAWVIVFVGAYLVYRFISGRTGGSAGATNAGTTAGTSLSAAVMLSLQDILSGGFSNPNSPNPVTPPSTGTTPPWVPGPIDSYRGPNDTIPGSVAGWLATLDTLQGDNWLAVYENGIRAGLTPPQDYRVLQQTLVQQGFNSQNSAMLLVRDPMAQHANTTGSNTSAIPTAFNGGPDLGISVPISAPSYSSPSIPYADWLAAGGQNWQPQPAQNSYTAPPAIDNSANIPSYATPDFTAPSVMQTRINQKLQR